MSNGERSNRNQEFCQQKSGDVSVPDKLRRLGFDERLSDGMKAAKMAAQQDLTSRMSHLDKGQAFGVPKNGWSITEKHQTSVGVVQDL